MGTAAIWNHEQERVDTDNSVLSLAHTHTYTRTYTFSHTRDRDKTKEWKDNDPLEGAKGDELNICVRLFVLLFAGFDANLIPRRCYCTIRVSSLTTITFLLNNKHVYMAVPLAIILGHSGKNLQLQRESFRISVCRIKIMDDISCENG